MLVLELELEQAYNNHEHFIELEVEQSVSVVDGDHTHVQIGDGMSDDQNDTILRGIYDDFHDRDHDHENHVRCKDIEG